jgi:hypothetical protein
MTETVTAGLGIHSGMSDLVINGDFGSTIPAWTTLENHNTVTELKKLSVSVQEIRERLLILERDLDMESRYPKLREAYDRYQKLVEDMKLIDNLRSES